MRKGASNQGSDDDDDGIFMVDLPPLSVYNEEALLEVAWSRYRY
jgi:hypothetical protein